ncbi:hypothetical protein LX36DRAFT_70855 [Colletotrichum falcatum]|nr:hypothetical protein LX36DRAFT_70855 [Colletotrichum falcatum]
MAFPYLCPLSVCLSVCLPVLWADKDRKRFATSIRRFMSNGDDIDGYGLPVDPLSHSPYHFLAAGRLHLGVTVTDPRTFELRFHLGTTFPAFTLSISKGVSLSALYLSVTQSEQPLTVSRVRLDVLAHLWSSAKRSIHPRLHTDSVLINQPFIQNESERGVGSILPAKISSHRIKQGPLGQKKKGTLIPRISTRLTPEWLQIAKRLSETVQCHWPGRMHTAASPNAISMTD